MAQCDFKNIRGAIFDMDGTLIDSMSAWETVGADYLRARGVEPRPDLAQNVATMSMAQIARHFREEYGLRESAAEIIDGINGMLAFFYREQAPLKPGVARFLAALSARGVLMCLATATDRPLLEAALTRLGVRRYFSEIFTCSEVGRGKDAPDIYEKARAFLGSDRAQTWIFEDALYAVRTARAAGFPVVGVWDAFERQTRQVEQLCDIYIHSFAELEAYLQ